SSGVCVEDGGHVVRSLCGSAQHCTVSTGFRIRPHPPRAGVGAGGDGRGRRWAAWEFRVESDASGDECSAIGAAVRPVSSSSYDCSPDLWMRRSYNGQLYDRGRPVSAAASNGLQQGRSTLSPVHQGDIVRIELDLTEGTLSYSLNGVDEGVAFTNMSGEIYPCVCTYRTGVQVRLLKVETWVRGGGCGGGLASLLRH
ncbi:unnamed protein product, partial [Discosporangium mesarthrocarpum]